MKLTMALASRGRPDLLLDTVKRTVANMVLPDTRLLVCLDEDDKPSREIIENLLGLDSRIKVSVNVREDSRGQKYDRALMSTPADIYMPTCDYAPLLTPGFDKMIVEAAEQFPDGIGVVYTQMANLSFPAYQAMTAKLVAKLGYIYPHYFPFWFIDHWMDDIARMIDRIAYVDVDCTPVIREGGHKTIGLRDLEFWTTLYDVGRVERRREALSIIADLDEPEWRKKALPKNFAMIDDRSAGINQGVRNNAAFIEKNRGGVESEPDERYQRIKAKADVLFDQWLRKLMAEHKWSNEAMAEYKPRLVSDNPNPTTMNADQINKLVADQVPGLVDKPAEPQVRRICLGLLAYDAKIMTRTMMCLMNSIAACAARGWGFTVIMRDADSMVARGRSLLASQFLENPESKNCSDLVMIDTDLAWDGDEFMRILDAPVDVIGGAYPFKDESGDFPLRWPADGLMEENGLWSVQAVTPGFFRVTRKALEKIAREMPWLEFKDKPSANGQRQWMFFDNIHRPSGIYDEGYIFCEHWRTVGGKVWLDPDLNLTHIGMKAYNHGTLRQWLDRKSAMFDRLESEYPGVPPLKLMKKIMGEKVDLTESESKDSAA